MNPPEHAAPHGPAHRFVALAADDRLAQAVADAAPSLAFVGRTAEPDDLPSLLADTGADVAVIVADADEPATAAIRLVAAAPPRAIVAVVPRLDAQMAVDAVAAGATALVPLPASGATIAATVSAALAGALVVPGALGAQVVRRDLAAALPALTDDELELLRLLVAGLDNADIAATVFASVRTVKRMLHVLYGKLGVNGRTEAALLGVRAGLTPPERA